MRALFDQPLRVLHLVWILAAGSLLIPAISPAQETDRQASRHAVYLEGLGHTTSGSLNYEYAFAPPYRLRVGVSPCRYWNRCMERGFDLSDTRLTVLYSRFFRHDRRSVDGLEVGGGVMVTGGEAEWDGWDIVKPVASVYGTLLVGYRYEPPGGGPVFRIGWTPILGLNATALRRLQWGGLSIGYAF